jgi:hypothetical protein
VPPTSDTCVRIHRRGGRIKILRGPHATRRGDYAGARCNGPQTVVHVALDRGRTVEVDQRDTIALPREA